METFFVSRHDLLEAEPGSVWYDLVTEAEGQVNDLIGWYYWFCLPGCLPDSEPYGPFATEEEAIADAKSEEEEEEE